MLLGQGKRSQSSGDSQSGRASILARRVSTVCDAQYFDSTPNLRVFDRLFMKGARNLEFDKLREICGDYQQLSYAKGM